MKAVGTVVYELEANDFQTLPKGQPVLCYDRQFGYHRMLTVGMDEFPKNTKRYVYLLLEAPKLPETINYSEGVRHG